jgi:aspartyl/glutamyl-tRNA(Asn/Gln) amidotransferase C subunit
LITSSGMVGVMSEISAEHITTLAALARVAVTSDQAANYAGQLSQVLAHFERLPKQTTHEEKSLEQNRDQQDCARPQSHFLHDLQGALVAGSQESHREHISVPNVMGEEGSA